MLSLLVSLCVLTPIWAGPPKAQKKIKNPIATVEMEKGGKIVIELYPRDAPITVANFIKLIKMKFYDGLTFHRVEPGFVVQGGDPNGDGSGGPGWTIKDEYNKLKHLEGSLGMAKTRQPNSAGSQFYICLGPAPHLDGGYTVFGRVIKGMDVVRKIRIGDRMKRVTITGTSASKRS